MIEDYNNKKVAAVGIRATGNYVAGSTVSRCKYCRVAVVDSTANDYNNRYYWAAAAGSTEKPSRC